MSGESVPGVLAGTKTQTRRLAGLEAVNEEPGRWVRKWGPMADGAWRFCDHPTQADKGTIVRCKPRYQVGETVYMKEAWQAVVYDDCGYHTDNGWEMDIQLVEYDKPLNQAYGGTRFLIAHRAGFHGDESLKWRSPLFMPQWASRAILRIERVRCERLQDISKRDAIAEGVTWSEAYPEGYTYPGCIRQSRGFGAAEHAYRDWWDAINKRHPWASNPWVFCYEFCRVQP